VFFCKGFFPIFCVSLRHFGSLDHFGFVLSKLVLLGLVYLVQSYDTGWEEYLQNDLFCIEWDVKQWCIGGYTRVYAVYQPPGYFGQRILTSVIINKQGTFRPIATPLCVYPPPFLAIHH